MKIQKQILQKLMALGNKKADRQLSILANEIKDNVLKSSDNDSAYQSLELIEEFVYKVPEQTIKIFKHLVKTSFPVSKSKTKFGIIEGKSRADVILKGLDLISEIRYVIPPDKTLPLLESAIRNEETSVKEKALEILKKFSEYNYTVLYKSKIGYRPQRMALDYILKWSPKKCFSNIDFILVVLERLLSSSVEGSSWTDEKTLTMNFSQVDPTDFLKKIRRESMDFNYFLYSKASDAKIRLRLSSILWEAMRAPTNIVYSDEIKSMIEGDTKHLANIYRKMIFDDSGNVIKKNIAVAEKIEGSLYFIVKSKKGRAKELAKLRNDILEDSFYNDVCPMIGGRIVYKDKEGYEESKALRSSDIDRIILEISGRTLNKWEKNLTVLANQKNIIEEWKFGELKQFIERLSTEKPEISDKLLGIAFEKNTSLILFSGSFMIGFQKSGNFDLWDKYFDLIAKEKSVYLAGEICTSLISPEDSSLRKRLRANELEILEEIVYKRKRFKYLKTKKEDNFNGYLHSFIFSAVASNYEKHKGKMEELLREEIDKNCEYNYIHYSELPFASVTKGWIDISSISRSFKAYLKRKMVETSKLDWHLQEFVFNLCDKKIDCVMEIFRRRISLYVKRKKDNNNSKNKKRISRNEFEATPYHFNSDLRKFILENENFPKIIQKWVLKMTAGWSYYNWEVSRFLENLKIDKNKIFTDIVANGKDGDLLRVAYAIESVGKANFDLCMQIVGQTDNKRIHSKIGSIMYATGVVSGEFGLAEAYEGKAELLKKYKDDKNDRIKKFATEMTKNLEKSAQEERKRANEEMQLRKIEFEG